MFTELVLAPLTTMDPTCAVDDVCQLASHVVPTLVPLTPATSNASTTHSVPSSKYQQSARPPHSCRV